MDDLINRQDAINLLKKWSGGYEYIETETELAIKEFKYLPSAQPEPVRRGRWIVVEDIGDCCYRCSNCGFIRDAYVLDVGKYCPSCGARMEEQE